MKFLTMSSTRCYHSNTVIQSKGNERVFKTAWFSKEANKAFIKDSELCKAIRQVMLGQADNLGGGVFKKRLERNRYRSIILAKGQKNWFYTYLFAKNNRENIDDRDLTEFRRLADFYASKTDEEIKNEMEINELVEICNEAKAEIQKQST